MGNCSPKPAEKPRASPASSNGKAASGLAPRAISFAPAVRLYGSDVCPVTWLLRVALLYKGAAVEFLHSERPAGAPAIQIVGKEVAKGTGEELLIYIDSAFPDGPRILTDEWKSTVGTPPEEVAAAVALHHRSIERHLAGVVRWAADMGGKGGKKGCVGGVRAEGAEGRRLGRWYAELMEVMLEHAQMEERILFPELERSYRNGICGVANEQHGRQLPKMNGIKEDIKTLLTMEVGTPDYKEVLLSLTLRLKSFQEHCKEHFREEEEKVIPLLENSYQIEKAEGDVSQWSNSGWLAQMMAVMEATHSQLFPFFMAGLLPHEAMQYLDLIFRCTKDQHRLVSMLQSLTARLDAATASSILCSNPLKLYEQFLLSTA